MSNNNKSFRFSHEETVPTYTIGAAFALAIILGLIVVSGVLLKPYEAREVVESLHERIMLAKEYRELSRIDYSPQKVAYSKPDDSTFPESKAAPAPSYAITIPSASAAKSTQKTDRAQSFDRDVKSDAYWKSLQASITNIKPALPSSAPVVIPPVVVGSVE